MLRRTVLLGTTALVGCSTTTGPDSTLLDLINKVTTVVSAIANTLLPVIGSIAGVPPNVIAYIGDAVSKMKDLVQQLVAIATMDAAKPLVKQIMDYVSAVLATLSGFALPGGISSVLADIQLVLPIIFAIIGMVIPMAARSSADTDAAWARLKLRAMRR